MSELADLAETLDHQLLLLTRPVRALKRFGVKDAMKERFEHTWHQRPLASHWAATIGMWGGVAGHPEIMERAKTDYVALKFFRAQNALTTRVGALSTRRPQWELAVSAFVKWQAEKKLPLEKRIFTVASHFGILPIELRIYTDHIADIAMSLRLNASDFIDKSSYDAVEAVWGERHDMIDTAVLSTYGQDDG